jgi:hypothetical protein
MKRGMHHGTWAHLKGLIHKTLLSICVFVCVSLSLLGNGSVKIYRGNEYARNNRIIVGRMIYMWSVSYQGK